MLRSVTSLLAVEIGQYCIADVVDDRGTASRLEIEHADPSRRARLRVACEDAVFAPDGRIARLVASRGSELLARVSPAARARSLGDIRLLDDATARSYMAATVDVEGAAVAVLTLIIAHGTRRYDEADLAFLRAVAEWTALGMENALRRDARHRSTRPANPMGEEASTAVRRNPLHAVERERASR